MIRPIAIHYCGSDNDQKCPNPLSCDDDGCERLDPRCRGKLGSRPSWMSPDQYDPCRCDQPKGHDGPHQCQHTRADGRVNPDA